MKLTSVARYAFIAVVLVLGWQCMNCLRIAAAAALMIGLYDAIVVSKQ